VTEDQNNNSPIPVSKATDKAAKYYKVSQCTMKKIRKKGKALTLMVFSVHQGRRGESQKITRQIILISMSSKK
jgi:hypothetical protein